MRVCDARRDVLPGSTRAFAGFLTMFLALFRSDRRRQWLDLSRRSPRSSARAEASLKPRARARPACALAAQRSGASEAAAALGIHRRSRCLSAATSSRRGSAPPLPQLVGPCACSLPAVLHSDWSLTAVPYAQNQILSRSARGTLSEQSLLTTGSWWPSATEWWNANAVEELVARGLLTASTLPVIGGGEPHPSYNRIFLSLELGGRGRGCPASASSGRFPRVAAVGGWGPTPADVRLMAR